jgi:DNA-binding MurR/RpiR family transcriptional regulator
MKRSSSSRDRSPAYTKGSPAGTYTTLESTLSHNDKVKLSEYVEKLNHFKTYFFTATMTKSCG